MKRQITELLKYGIYGVCTTAINFILFVVMNACGLHYILSNTVSYFLAVCINYILNRKYVFTDRQDSSKAESAAFFKFVLVRLAALSVDNICFYLFVTLSGRNLYVIRILLSSVSILLTFIANKWFVFKRKEKDSHKKRIQEK